jgi:hypothetical protein
MSFASMVMASRIGEVAAVRLHATELLMMLGAAVLMAIEPPFRAEAGPMRERPPQPEIYPFSSPSS